jgi:D-sedoheptulose 7-phosphate isomerase
MRLYLIQAELNDLSSLARDVANRLAEEIRQLADLYAGTIAAGGRLYFVGNGGSAADAQHIAAEYVVRLGRDRRPLPALALTTDTSVLTACANDLSFDDVYARQVAALCGPRDLLVIHSTSGASTNVIRAANAAREMGVKVAALLGRDGGPLKSQVDFALVVPSNSTSHIQEMHLAIEHVVCALVEQEVAAA